MNNIKKAAQVIWENMPYSLRETSAETAQALADAGLLVSDECLCEGADGVTTPKCPANLLTPVTRTEWGVRMCNGSVGASSSREAAVRDLPAYLGSRVVSRQVTEWVEAP